MRTASCVVHLLQIPGTIAYATLSDTTLDMPPQLTHSKFRYDVTHFMTSFLLSANFKQVRRLIRPF